MAYEQTVVALFAAGEDAQKAIARLIEGGINPERIGFLEPLDKRELKNPARGAGEGMAAGGAAGAVIGGLFIGLIPGLGQALIAGALLPVVLGTVVGAIGGGTMGGLVGATLTSEEEPYFMEEVQAGRILVSVGIERGEADVEKLLAADALEVDRLGTATLHARLRHLPSSL